MAPEAEPYKKIVNGISTTTNSSICVFAIRDLFCLQSKQMKGENIRRKMLFWFFLKCFLFHSFNFLDTTHLKF